MILIVYEDKMSASEFKLSTLEMLFRSSLEDPDISLKDYVDGYEQVYKFLSLLGTLFGWVGADVQVKVDNIRKHMVGEKSQHYTTVRAMIEYENESGLILWKKTSDLSGSRNLLILHRALQYVVAFLAKLENIDEEEKCTNISREAYESTLMKYHPWVVQKAAKVAMNLLPTKKALVLKIAPSGEQEEINKAYAEFPNAVSSMERAYDVIDKLIEQYNLQSLKVQ
ncbi:ceramide-1-phosphate transfer protein [Eurytemora carolleeae]|uniref:ceramide-1-phosphate transfer protein n=1 Tax=Eurytemora carolleeae TaxID=1294199 RepID=UPI000C7619CB|nr:ceramide-1-phosphate transfer protein [Eurytemora carolleeae]|eukprot:XP_023341765.1 ceramide-1-phosphate transfer protein-like [Eurytemora affinis]